MKPFIRKLRRSLKNTSVLVATLLFLTSLFMWARSSFREDTLTYRSNHGTGINFEITSAEGILSLEQFPAGFEDMTEDPSITRHFEFKTIPQEPDKIYGIGWAPADEPFYRRFYFNFSVWVFVALPYWAISISTGIIPAWWLTRTIKLKRRSQRRKTQTL